MEDFIMKRIGKLLFIFILAAVIVIVCYLLFMTATDYRPKEKLTLDINNNQVSKIKSDTEYSLMTYNIGYCGLDD